MQSAENVFVRMQRILINALLQAEMTLSTDIPPAGVCEALGPTATSTWLQLYWRHGDEDKANRRLNRGNRLQPLSGAYTELQAFSGTQGPAKIRKHIIYDLARGWFVSVNHLKEVFSQGRHMGGARTETLLVQPWGGRLQ
jgi:hypothetical protein